MPGPREIRREKTAIAGRPDLEPRRWARYWPSPSEFCSVHGEARDLAGILENPDAEQGNQREDQTRGRNLPGDPAPPGCRNVSSWGDGTASTQSLPHLLAIINKVPLEANLAKTRFYKLP